MIRLLALGKASRSGWLLAVLLAALPLAAAEHSRVDEPLMDEQTAEESAADEQGVDPLAGQDTEGDALPIEASPEPSDEQTVQPDTAPALDGGVPSVPPFPPRSQFDEMLQRPLFHSSRRPQAGEPSGGSAQELRETWKLTGIILVGEQVRALFQERNGERRLTLGTGMPLDDSWVLDEINLETVVMGSGDEQVTLELLEPRDTAPLAAPEGEAQAGDKEAAPLDERTQEASRQLQQDTESVKETLNE